MNLKQLIKASGGPSLCASIWGMARSNVSQIFKRNSISVGLLKELRAHHLEQVGAINSILSGNANIEFEVTTRKSARRKKCTD